MRLRQLRCFEYELRRHHDHSDRSSQVVTKDREETILRLSHLVSVRRDRLGDSLIDRFVEPDHVLQIGKPGLLLPAGPETNDARAQRTEFRHHLLDTEAAFCSTRSMCLRSGW